VRRVTSEQVHLSLCLACGSTVAPVLERFASLRCHDCRDTAAPILPELARAVVAPAPRSVRLQAA